MSLSGTLSPLNPMNNKVQVPIDNNPSPAGPQGPPTIVRPYVLSKIIPPGLSLVNGYLISPNITTIVGN